MQRLVVVGASLAGLRAAQAARAAGFTGELVLVGEAIGVVAFNAPRRLAWYRRQLVSAPDIEALREQVAADGKALGAPVGAAMTPALILQHGDDGEALAESGRAHAVSARRSAFQLFDALWSEARQSERRA